jgi:hypothetical protein
MRGNSSVINIAFRGLIGATNIFLVACSSEDRGVAPAIDAEAPLPDGASTPDGAEHEAGPVSRFSFFVTSITAMRELSGSPDGFGGDLRFGQADGLSGGDEICRQVAERSVPNNGKVWRAFLSVTKGPDGAPVHAIDRVGQGPWYDRVGRLVALNLDDLVQQRPRGADPAIINDLPNEYGTPNHDPDGTGNVDNHDMLTGTDAKGRLYGTDWGATCHDWTSKVGSDGRPHCGHSWPRTGGGGGGGGFPGRDGGRPPIILDGGIFPGEGGIIPPGGGFDDLNNWMSALDEAGCAPGVNLIETGPPNPANPTVGSGGGYGGIYCFALTP